MLDSTMFQYFNAIGDIKSSIAGAKDFEEALRLCAQIIRKVSKAESIIIWYYDRDGDKRLHPVYSLGKYHISFGSVLPGEGILGWVYETQTSFYGLDYQKEKGDIELEGLEGVEIHSLMCVPFYNKYETYGCFLFVNRSDGELFTQEDSDICEIMTMIAAIAIDENDLDLGVSISKPILITLRDIKKSFKNGDTVTQVLKGVDLDVYEGELLVILGESGCGKSTLLNIIGGLDRASEGCFCFMGEDYTSVGIAAEHLGYKGFFFSILLFVGLGIGIFLGIRWNGPALQNTANQYYDENRFHDFVVNYPYGVTEEDIAAISALEDISEVEGGYMTEGTTRIGSESYVVAVQSLTEQLDIASVEEGVLPEAPDEVGIGPAMARETGLGVGDKLTVHAQRGGNDSLNATELSMPLRIYGRVWEGL